MYLMYEPTTFGAWIVTFCLLCFTLLYFFRRYKYRNFPPGPRGLPLVGYLPYLGNHPAKTFLKLSEKYGPIFSFNMGIERWVVLNDYDVIQEALVKQGHVFSGRQNGHIVEKITGGLGVATVDYGDHWKRQRKFGITTLRGFRVGKKSMEDRIIEETRYLCDVILSKNGESFNCQNTIAKAVSNIICSVFMGSRFSYDDKRFTTIVERLNVGFSDNLDAKLVGVMMFAPFLRFFPFFRGSYDRFFDDVKLILGIIQNCIQEQKDSFDPNNIRDFIDEYLKEMNRKTDKSFTDGQLLQYIRDLFVAGSETVSSTLRWSVLSMVIFPEFQDKIATEILSVIGESGIPSMKHRDDMPYTCAFIQELMRHRTLLPIGVPHKTSENAHLRGFDIPKDIPIVANIFAVHNDPKYFKNPEEFRPERFIDDEGKFVLDNHVIPFSVGPRYCLGEQLAKMEVFLFLITIVQKFRIVQDPKKPLPDFEGLVLGLVQVPKTFEVKFEQR